MTTTTDYNKQATDFLSKVGATIEIRLLKYGKHFEGDKEERAIYTVTLGKGGRKYTFDFGQSIARSYPYNVKANLRTKLWNEQTTGGKYGITEQEAKGKNMFNIQRGDIVKNEDYGAPTEYDILSCLQKYDIGTFENFCAEFGYDTDSRKAYKVYKAVCEEYKSLSTLFSAQEMNQMTEIQ